MPSQPTSILLSSPQNPHIKHAVRLWKRSARDAEGLMLIEGYREVSRALAHGVNPLKLFYCPALFLGENEPVLIAGCREAGATTYECTAAVFEKISYRDRPDGLLAIAPQHHRPLTDLRLSSQPLLVIAESIEKPGNLGTILRTADASGADAVVVCDPRTDICNPNVVRASTGTLFIVPVAETTTGEALTWLRRQGIQIVAATPHAEMEYTDVDFTRGTAIVMGTEQYGLSQEWMQAADCKVRIPMLGQADSLNVAAATTILLYEAVRQRRQKTITVPKAQPTRS